jgi:uncharacterized membrane protein YhhN
VTTVPRSGEFVVVDTAPRPGLHCVTMRVPAIAAVTVLGAAHILARYGGARVIAGLLKPLPVLLLIALVMLHDGPAGYRLLVAAGLLCSMAGDIWLLFERHFGRGLASFLVAHLFYIAAFVPALGGTAGAWFVIVPLALYGSVLLGYLWPHLGGVRLPVLAYVSVIALMVVCAAMRAPAVPLQTGALALVGALFFLASDSLLAIDRFARPFGSAVAAVMVTYYTAQTLIALSAVV